MTKKRLCKNCKHLEHDGMFGIFCGVGGNNTKYDCPKYESGRMTEKECFFIKGRECEKGNDKCIYVLNIQCRIKEEVE